MSKEGGGIVVRNMAVLVYYNIHKNDVLLLLFVLLYGTEGTLCRKVGPYIIYFIDYTRGEDYAQQYNL